MTKNLVMTDHRREMVQKAVSVLMQRRFYLHWSQCPLTLRQVELAQMTDEQREIIQRAYDLAPRMVTLTSGFSIHVQDANVLLAVRTPNAIPSLQHDENVYINTTEFKAEARVVKTATVVNTPELVKWAREWVHLRDRMLGVNNIITVLVRSCAKTANLAATWPRAVAVLRNEASINENYPLRGDWLEMAAVLAAAPMRGLATYKVKFPGDPKMYDRLKALDYVIAEAMLLPAQDRNPTILDGMTLHKVASVVP